MQNLKSFLLVLCTIMPLAVSERGYAQNADCRSCHAPSGATGARDFSHIYANPSSHHPVDIEYSAGLNTKPNFKQPNGQNAEITFFDKNGNGQPDNNEVQLYNESGVDTVECATCHKEHGDGASPAEESRNHYLRFENIGSALCVTCHIY